VSQLSIPIATGDVATILAVETRRTARGEPGYAPPLAIGTTRDGRIWLATCRDDAGKYAGTTLAEAAVMWLAAHPITED